MSFGPKLMSFGPQPKCPSEPEPKRPSGPNVNIFQALSQMSFGPKPNCTSER